jgi:hypothetical protein
LILLHQKRELFKKEGSEKEHDGSIDVTYMTEFLLENTDIIDPYGELTLCIRCVYVHTYMDGFECIHEYAYIFKDICMIICMYLL